jgi:hypothetical protein
MRSHPAIAVALVALIAQVAHAQGAPQGVRLAGTVKSVAADTLILTTAKGDVDIRMTPQTRILVSQPASAGDIKPGAYLGTSNQDASVANTGTATEIHLADNGPNVNFPMNHTGLTMTNGHVTSVTHTANGEEMVIDDGQAMKRHVVVPSDTRITRMADVGAAGLKPHVRVTTMTTTGTDGKPVATFIMVAPPAAAK